ncbi:hypothetical protein CDAR_297181 [Caerostris darwini]|uniref:Uncharacterized protein n=1 Tax=Caerostris darwini TaxID=1538125 RepID=A0AAV4PP63_9ARAC|nr:hypothetical protein CDAR_297181 [Caerostris darwini]
MGFRTGILGSIPDSMINVGRMLFRCELCFEKALWERGKKLKDPWIAHPLGPTGKVSQQEKQFSLGTWIADSGDNVIISFSISQLDRHLDTRPTVLDALTPFSSLAIGGINGEVKMCS